MSAVTRSTSKNTISMSREPDARLSKGSSGSQGDALIQRVMALGDIVEFIRNGLSISNRNGVGGIPITRIETISDHRIDPDRVGYAGVGIGERDDWLLRPGDILFSHINSVSHLGKCAIYEGMPDHLLHGMNLLSIRPKAEVVLPRFLVRTLRSDYFRLQLVRHIKPAVNQASVSISALRTLQISVPSIAEQRRIADILDKADAIRRKRKEAIALTEELLRSTFLDMFGDPVTNPKGWPVKALGATFDTDPRIGTLVPATELPGIPVVRVGELGHYDVALDRCKRVVLSESELARFEATTGDVLIARAIGSEEHLGKASVLQECSERVAFDSHVMRLRFQRDLMEPYFFVHWLRSPGGRMRFMREGGRTAVQFNINGKQIAKVQVPLPPLNEQRRFCELFDKVRQCETKGLGAVREAELLFATLVQQLLSQPGRSIVAAS